MSDVDYSADFDPANFILNEQRGAKITALNSLEDEPDKAARAQQLADATGEHPALVYGDLENFEAQHKAQLTSDLLNNNAFLQEYVNSHPLAAKISNDDYGQLDAVSQAAKKFMDVPGIGVVPTSPPDFNANWINEPNKRLPSGELPKGVELLTTPEGNYNLLRAVALYPSYAIKGLTDVVIRAMQPGATAEDREAFGAMIALLIEGGKLPMPWAKTLRTAAPADIRLGRPETPPLSSTAEIIQFLKDVDTYSTEAGQPTALKALIPYFEAGKSPPVGVHPDVDTLHVEQAKTDAKNLSEALKESVASATRERSPDLFTSFVAQHTGEGQIGISADAVRKLYGDKVPVAGEGPLGFVPDLAAQLARAEATGGDIQVDVAKYLGHVDPEVHKELADSIRARPEGVTVEEGKDFPVEQPAETQLAQGYKIEQEPTGWYILSKDGKPLGRYDTLIEANSAAPREPVDTIRQAAGLQGQVAERKLELRKTDSASTRDGDVAHVVEIHDEQGYRGEINLAEEKGGKVLYVDNMGAAGGPSSIGPAGMRSLLEQLKEMFPNAETLEGMRVSGAREKAGIEDAKDLKTSIDLTKIKPRAKAPEAEAPGLLQRAKEAVLGKSEEAKAAEAKAMEERELFDKASAIGMTVDQFKRYAKLIEQRAAEDAEAASARALAEQTKRQTAEWKANRAELRPKVKEEVLARSEVELDEMLREGKIKLATEGLTPDQRALLPKDYVAADGVHPEDLAGLFGDQHGGALVDRVIGLTQGREAAGMKPKPHLERLVDAETDRQMEAKYGSLDKNILDEAKDQVLSETQESLLHEELLARAEEAGMQLTITKDELKAAIKGSFDRQLVRDTSSDRALAEAGRAGRATEMALLKGDYAEAFRQKQRQFNAFTMATYAKKFEKVQAQFEKAAKRFSAREVAGVDQEYTNWVHDILTRVGEPVKRAPDDLQAALANGVHPTLSEFVNYKQGHDMRDLPVADFLLDPNFKTKADNLTTKQFEELNNSVKTMAFNGRDELKIERAGEKEDLRAVINEMIEKMATLGGRDYPVDRPRSKVIEHTKSWWWSGITVESMLNRLDRDNPRGVFNETIVRPFTEASNNKDKLIREYQDKISKIGNIPDMDKLAENTFLQDPITERPLVLRKRNVLGILQNIGNEGNLSKLAQGYKVAPETLMNWLLRNTEKADWDRAQQIGDLFEEIFDKANMMSRNVAGVDVEKIPLKPIETPYGTYKGWYNPIKYDRLRPGESKTLLGQGIEQEGYYRATTPQGYAKGRTGYVAPIELNLDVVPERMKQMLHDIAMRPAVIQIGKIFYDPAFKRAMIKHVGEHQAEEMIPFLRDIANAANFQSLSASMGNQALEYFRQNTIATLIGFNPGTVMKHGTTALINSMSEVGAVNFMREFKNVITDLPQGRENWKMAMEKSEELQRRMRNFSELIAGHGSEINLRGARSNSASFREFMMSAGATPVSLSDLASAVPTWLAKYKDGIAEGLDEGRAVSDGNRAVRRAHGSSVLSNKPSIARTNALGATFSSLYGFFSHMQQKQYELAWKARDTWKDKFGKGTGDTEDTTRHIPDLVKGFFSFIVLPAIIEELVTPYTNSEKDSWGVKAAKTLGLGVSASFIGVRDFVRGLINLRDPSAGLIGTSLKAATDLGRDLSHGKKAFSKDKMGNLIEHAFALTGVLSGLTNAQEGKVLQYLYNFSHGREHPKGPWSVGVGLRYGKSDKHSQTFEQWRKGH